MSIRTFCFFLMAMIFSVALCKADGIATTPQATHLAASSSVGQTSPHLEQTFFGLHSGLGENVSHEFKKVILVECCFFVVVMVMVIKFYIDAKGDKTHYY